MAEWPNVPDSKSGVPQGTVGSNPTLSAKKSTKTGPCGSFYFLPTNLPTIDFIARLGAVLRPTPLAFPFVLRLGVGNGLPLHVARCISPMTGYRDDVVDHAALAGPFGRSCGWAGVLLLELLPGGLRPCVLLGGWPSATPPSRLLRSAKKRQLPYFHLAEKPFPADPTVPPTPRFDRVIASLTGSLFPTNNSKNSRVCVKGWTSGQHGHVGRHCRAASLRQALPLKRVSLGWALS